MTHPPRPRAATPRDGIAWITGASSGIGLAVAKQLLADGWTVAATARSRGGLDALAAANTGRLIVALGDVVDAASLRAAVDLARTTSGREVALAILNAGTWYQMGADNFDLEKFHTAVDVNINGTANALAAVMPAMIARGGGQIAITASVAGFVGLPNAVAYGPTKAAQISLAESLKFDLDRRGVMINVICPGFVRTPMTAVNDFPMPFIIEADEAARIITRELRRGTFEIVFPRRMAVTMKIVRSLPYWLLFGAVGGATSGKARR